jgi:hypothetical protein
MNMSESIEEMGPVDYVLLEWSGSQPDGSALPHLLDIVDAGIIRILDIAFLSKDESGTLTALELSDLDDSFGVFDGAASGLLSSEDLDEAAEAMESGTSAALLVWENRWAAPFATALRKNGAQMIASGRIPLQAMLAASEALAKA